MTMEMITKIGDWELMYFASIGYEWQNVKDGRSVGIFSKKRDALLKYNAPEVYEVLK